MTTLSPVNRPLLIPGLPRVWRGAARAPARLRSRPRRVGAAPRPPGRRRAGPARRHPARAGRPGARGRARRPGGRRPRACSTPCTRPDSSCPRPRLLPITLPPETRRRLMGEAAALALRSVGGEPAPAAVLRRRAAARVVVTGRGRLGAPIAVALAEAGVGHVRADLTGVVGPGELAGGPLRGSDVGRPRQRGDHRGRPARRAGHADRFGTPDARLPGRPARPRRAGEPGRRRVRRSPPAASGGHHPGGRRRDRPAGAGRRARRA